MSKDQHHPQTEPAQPCGIVSTMPEPPDFEQLARQAISGSEFHIKRVAEQLRQVWNARGDADLIAAESPIASCEGLMPETLDLESLARRLFPVGDEFDRVIGRLRFIWNARGAADIETLPGGYVDDAARAIRTLDR